MRPIARFSLRGLGPGHLVAAVVIVNGAFTRWYTGQAVLHAVAGVGFAVTIAVYKYRLYDIDIIINRTLVYLLLTGTIAGGYIAIVTGIGALVPHHGLAVELLAAGQVHAPCPSVTSRRGHSP